MKNIDLNTVFVILTKDYGDNPVRVVAVVDEKHKTNVWCGKDSPLKNHYWYEEAKID